MTEYNYAMARRRMKKKTKSRISLYFKTLAIFLAISFALIGCGLVFTNALDENDKEKASRLVSKFSSKVEKLISSDDEETDENNEPEGEAVVEPDAEESAASENADNAGTEPGKTQARSDSGSAASSFGAGILNSTSDINLHSVDGGSKNYAFSYNGSEFSAIYTTDNWKIIDSYLIDNTADITIICEALIAEHPIHGSDMQSYRTADDMAYEWEQHNLAYTFLPEGNRWKGKTKDVDLNPADQGLSFDEIYERQTGKKLSIEELLKHLSN